MRMVAICVGAALLALPPGCGGDDGGDRAPEGPLVVYARSGGIASMPERLTIEVDGSATLEYGIDGETASFRLGGDELDNLDAELEAADFDAVEQPGEPSTCADCFLYEVVYGGRTISYDDVDTPPASVTAVVAHLGEIASAHYPPVP